MDVAVEILVDHSASMQGQKFQCAKEILKNVAPELLRSATLIGAKTFSGCSFPIDAKYKFHLDFCREDTLYNFIDDIKDPSGGTPIAGAIREVVESFKSLTEARKFIPKIVLVTDGWETCDGDWKAEIENAKLNGVNCEIHIVGIELSDQDTQQAQEAALQTGGTFMAVTSTPDNIQIKSLVDNFRQVVLKPKSLTHTFNLRSDLSIEFTLPTDLTNKEAERIAAFIKTLPIE